MESTTCSTHYYLEALDSNLFYRSCGTRLTTFMIALLHMKVYNGESSLKTSSPWAHLTLEAALQSLSICTGGAFVFPISLWTTPKNLNFGSDSVGSKKTNSSRIIFVQGVFQLIQVRVRIAKVKISRVLATLKPRSSQSTGMSFFKYLLQSACSP